MRKIILTVIMMLWSSKVFAFTVLDAYKYYQRQDTEIVIFTYVKGILSGFAMGQGIEKIEEPDILSEYEHCARGLDAVNIINRFFTKFEEGDVKASDSFEVNILLAALPDMKECQKKAKTQQKKNLKYDDTDWNIEPFVLNQQSSVVSENKIAD